MKYKFGDRGIWHRPKSERKKAKDIPVVVLEQVKVGDAGLLYIFTYEKPMPRNLTYRTATIFPSDFTLNKD